MYALTWGPLGRGYEMIGSGDSKYLCYAGTVELDQTYALSDKRTLFREFADLDVGSDERILDFACRHGTLYPLHIWPTGSRELTVGFLGDHPLEQDPLRAAQRDDLLRTEKHVPLEPYGVGEARFLWVNAIRAMRRCVKIWRDLQDKRDDRIRRYICWDDEERRILYIDPRLRLIEILIGRTCLRYRSQVRRSSLLIPTLRPRKV